MRAAKYFVSPGQQLLLLLLACLTLAGCTTITTRIEVTPGTVPPQIRGASWPDLPVSYCVAQDEGFVSHDELVDLTQQAFERWQVETVYEGTCSGLVAGANGRNEIYFGEIGHEGSRINEAGNTHLRYRNVLSGGTQIVEADIVLDRNPPSEQRSSDCLFTTLLHETGHFLGVQHQATPAVMAPVINECLQELTQTDRQAIDELY